MPSILSTAAVAMALVSSVAASCIAPKLTNTRRIVSGVNNPNALKTQCSSDAPYTVSDDDFEDKFGPDTVACDPYYTSAVRSAIANGLFGLKDDLIGDNKRDCSAYCLYDYKWKGPNKRAYRWKPEDKCWKNLRSSYCPDASDGEKRNAKAAFAQICSPCEKDAWFQSVGDFSRETLGTKSLSCEGEGEKYLEESSRKLLPSEQCLWTSAKFALPQTYTKETAYKQAYLRAQIFERKVDDVLKFDRMEFYVRTCKKDDIDDCSDWVKHIRVIGDFIGPGDEDDKYTVTGISVDASNKANIPIIQRTTNNQRIKITEGSDFQQQDVNLSNDDGYVQVKIYLQNARFPWSSQEIHRVLNINVAASCKDATALDE